MLAGVGQLRASIKSMIQSELKKVWLPSECCQSQYTVQPFRGHELLTATLIGDGSKKLTKGRPVIGDKLQLDHAEQ